MGSRVMHRQQLTSLKAQLTQLASSADHGEDFATSGANGVAGGQQNATTVAPGTYSEPAC